MPHRTVRKAPRTAPSTRALKLRLRRLEAECERLANRLASAKRAADRKLAAMVQEIAQLRHHEARAAALERLLAEREAAKVERNHPG